MSHKTTEEEVSEAVLRILVNRPDGEAKQSYLRGEIPNFIQLTQDDQKQSKTRPLEAVWEQLVRNIVSHKENEGNYIAEGFLVVPRRGWLKITEAGRRRVA